MADWTVIDGGVTAPQGYRAAGIAAGLKPSGQPDLALIVSDQVAIASGVFTTNQVRAACVDYCQQHLLRGRAQAILCNAGQANAGTGAQGAQAVVDKAQWVGDALQIDPDTVLIASTGVIGQQIPLDKVQAGLPQLVAQLSPTGPDQAAQAIITTDLVTKSIALEAQINGHTIRVGGIAKGSGMIHPDMATLLAFVTCDATVSPDLWQAIVRRAADRSFNQITVDGDTSTNDMLLAFANGCAEAPAITAGPAADQLEAMVTAVCADLAKKIARDGEGATCLMEIQVSGSQDDAAARKIARTVAGSMLTKAAVFGRDPNWGRIAGAAGRAGVAFNAQHLDIHIGEFVLMTQGTPQPFDREAASQYLKQDPVMIKISVGDGPGTGTAWGCDLSYDYVKINAEYTT